MNITFFVVYMSLNVIVLLNLLIALMNNYFGKVIEIVESEWRLEQAKIIADIEREYGRTFDESVCFSC